MKKAKTDDEIFIEEIIHSVKQKDLIKVKILLRETSTVSSSTTKRLLFEIARSDDSFAIPLLVHIMAYHLELVAVNPGIQSVLEDKITYCESLYEIFLTLTDINERCFFIENLAGNSSENVIKFLISAVTKETDIRILASILKAMSDLKNKKFAPYISDFLYSNDSSLVHLAINALGSCATDLAIDVLVSRTGADAGLDKLIVSTISRIKSEKSMNALTGFLTSDNSTTRNAARTALASLKAAAVPYLVESLKNSNRNKVIITLNVLGETGVEEAVKPVRNFIETMPEDANVRFAAYEALGFLPGKTGAYTLTQGLLDEDEGVRVAAAKAINEQFDQLFERGISNLFKVENNRPFITDAILTAECNKIVSSMVHLDEFNECAVQILRQCKDKEAIEFYTKLAKNINLSCDIGAGKKATAVSAATQICVVDDSRLLLKIYKKILTELDVEFHLFEFAEAALEFISSNKPALILTDLNMPEMDGIEFTEKVREKFSGDEVPIVMVTTQDEESDRSAALKAGVNDYLHKPFDKEGIKKVLERFKI